MFLDSASDTGSMARMHKEPQNSENGKTNSPVKNQAKGIDWHFSKDEIQINIIHLKRCSGSLALRDVQTEGPQ